MKARIYAFDEVDRPDEVARAFSELRQEVINEVDALQTELKGCVRRKPEKPKRIRGFVMRNVLLSIAVIGIVLGFGMVVQAQYQKGDINYDIVSNPAQLEQWLRDVVGSGYFVFDELATPSGNDIETGKMYLDSGGGLYYSTNGSTWTAISTGAGNSLDGAYNAGASIDVDATTITLDNDVGDNTVCLTITQDDTTNDPDAVHITSAGDGAGSVTLQLESAAGYDIQGSGDLWNIEDSGLANLVGITTSSTISLANAETIIGDTAHRYFGSYCLACYQRWYGEKYQQQKLSHYKNAGQ